MNFEPERIIKEIDAQYGKRSVADMETYLIQTINGVAEKYGVNSAGFASLLNELGGFYRTTSRYQKSEEFFLKAKEIIERTMGEENPDYATTLNNLAGVYRLTGDFIKAEKMFLRAIEIYKRISYEESFVYASALNNLGLIYMDTKKFEKAVLLFEEANKISKTSKNSPIIYATGLGNLANAYLALGQIERARKMLIEAATVYKTFNKEDNNHYASALNSLGTFYFTTNSFRKAEPLFLKVLALREKDFGQNHHEFAKTAYNLCELYEKTGRYDLAKKYARLSAESYQYILGKDHPSYKASITAINRIERLMNFSESPKEISGMEFSLMSFVQFSATVLCKKFPQYIDRIAAGLVGEGSECFGFDDEFSKDHDWGPGFCLWLSKEDFEKIGSSLEQEYENHLNEYIADPLNQSKKSSRIPPRRGVFEVSGFFHSYIGIDTPPQSLNEWQKMSESKLSAVTNGKIFVDPLGEFSHFQKELLKFYPEDLRLKKIATSCALMAQSGQYNYPRSIKRHEYIAAQQALAIFIDSTITLIFLLNRKYKPYYKWMHRAMKALPILGSELYAPLEKLAADSGATNPISFEQKLVLIEEICRAVIETLKSHGLCNADETFLMTQAIHIHQKIKSPVLQMLPIILEK